MIIRTLQWNGKEITLVGTAHVSRESVEMVRETILRQKPDSVGVELDAARLHQLKTHTKWQNTNISEVIRSGQTYLFLFNLVLANMQARLGKELGVSPGAEFLAAVEAGKEHGIPVGLLDRDIRITLQRLVARMSWMEKIKLGGSVMGSLLGMGERVTPEKLAELKDQDVISSLVTELEGTLPNLKKVLVDERDVYLAQNIKKLPGKRVVVVVGAGHLNGIERALGVEADVKALETIPKGRSYWKGVKYAVPLLFLAILGYGIFTKGIGVSLGILGYWIVINGTLSALGVVIARGHPLSVLAAFAAAPFTSLHPFLAAGWFAGLAEIRMRMPRVKDFEGLQKLNSIGDLYQNQVTHILLVVALANVGSTIGTVIALPYVISLLG